MCDSQTCSSQLSPRLALQGAGCSKVLSRRNGEIGLALVYPKSSQVPAVHSMAVVQLPCKTAVLGETRVHVLLEPRFAGLFSVELCHGQHLVKTTLPEACLNVFHVCQTNVINTEITG